MSAKSELNSIIAELYSISTQLDSLSDEIRRDFVGIGNEKCANKLYNVSNAFRDVRIKLLSIDQSKLDQPKEE